MRKARTLATSSANVEQSGRERAQKPYCGHLFLTFDLKAALWRLYLSIIPGIQDDCPYLIRSLHIFFYSIFILRKNRTIRLKTRFTDDDCFLKMRICKNHTFLKENTFLKNAQCQFSEMTVRSISLSACSNAMRGQVNSHIIYI